MIDKRQQQTIAYYDREAENWIAGRGGFDAPSYWQEELDRFQHFLPAGRVLEIGPGAGKEAAQLLARGYDYTGMDASESLLQFARRRNPHARFVHKDIHALDGSLGTFDGFWASAVLLHIPKDGIDDVLQRIRRLLNPEGIGFISLKQGEGERPDPDTERWFAYYQQKEFADILERTGFTVLETAIQPRWKDIWLVFYVQAGANAGHASQPSGETP